VYSDNFVAGARMAVDALSSFYNTAAGNGGGLFVVVQGCIGCVSNISVEVSNTVVTDNTAGKAFSHNPALLRACRAQSACAQ
jgi:hypothetical protein